MIQPFFPNKITPLKPLQQKLEDPSKYGGNFLSDPKQNHHPSLSSEGKTTHKKSDVSRLFQCQLMIGIDGFHHHSGTCRQPTNTKHQNCLFFKIQTTSTTSPFPAPTKNKLDTQKKTQQKVHHTFSDHTDQHL